MNVATQPDALRSPPDLSIRARPPSPKRLSRKVLLGGAIVLAAVVSAALLFGLSAQPSRYARDAEMHASAAGALETIQGAPADYASADLGREFFEDHPAIESLPGNELAPPRDPG